MLESKGVIMKRRGIRGIAVGAISVAVVALTVAFAALSQILTISGTAKMTGTSWNIHFGNPTNPILSGNAVMDRTPVVNGTTLDFGVVLDQPGDSVTFSVPLINTGTIDAQISNFSLTGVNEASAKKINYLVTGINVGDDLLAGDSKTATITVSFDANATSEDIPVDGFTLALGATINVTQK